MRDDNLAERGAPASVTYLTVALRAHDIEGVLWGEPVFKGVGQPRHEGTPIGADEVLINVRWPFLGIPRPGDEISGMSLNKGRVWVDRVEWDIKGKVIAHCRVKP